MEAKAKARFVRVTPQKARRVVDLIRGKQAGEAVAVLKFAPQAAGETVLKVVESAIANARSRLPSAATSVSTRRTSYISEVFVDEGPTLKRFRPRAQGRASQILKRTSHITVVVAERETKGGPDSGTEGQPARVPPGHHDRPPVALVRRLAPSRVSATATTSARTSRSASSWPRASSAPASPRSRSSARVTASASTSTPPARASSSGVVAPRPTASAASSRSSRASRSS